MSFILLVLSLILTYTNGFSVQVWYWHPGCCPLGKHLFFFRQILFCNKVFCVWVILYIFNFLTFLYRVQNAEVLCLGLVSAAVFTLVLPLFRTTGGILLQTAPPSIPTSALSKCLRQVITLISVIKFPMRLILYFNRDESYLLLS